MVAQTAAVEMNFRMNTLLQDGAVWLARLAHNEKVTGSNPVPATNFGVAPRKQKTNKHNYEKTENGSYRPRGFAGGDDRLHNSSRPSS